MEFRHAVYPERHARDASCDDVVLLRVPDPRHAEVDGGEDDRGQGLDLSVLEQAHVLDAVGLLDVADGVLDPPAGDVALHDLPEGLARRCLREGRQQHHRPLPESPHDDHVQEPVGDVGKPHGHDAELDRHATLLPVVVERHDLPVAHPALPGEFTAHDVALPAAHVALLEADDEIQPFFEEMAVELDVVSATVVHEYPPLLRMLRDSIHDGLHLLVLADEPGRVRRPQPEVQRDRPPASAFAGHGHAAPEAEVVAHLALAAVPDLGEVLHLLRVGLLHVGRVQDDERVPVDPLGALGGDEAVQPRLQPVRREHPAEPVLDLFRCGFLLQRADYGRELHVLLDHDSVDHVAYETGDRLVEMGRNPPQKRFKLPEQFRRNCGTIHGVAFRVWFLALRIIAKIELEGRLSFPKIGS